MMDFDDWWGDDWEGCRASAQGVWDYQQRRIEALEAALQKVMDLGVTFEQEAG